MNGYRIHCIVGDAEGNTLCHSLLPYKARCSEDIFNRTLDSAGWPTGSVSERIHLLEG